MTMKEGFVASLSLLGIVSCMVCSILFFMLIIPWFFHLMDASNRAADAYFAAPTPTPIPFTGYGFGTTP